MRRLLLAAVMTMTAAGAHAADMPDFLRGSLSDGPSAPTRNWEGWYAGGEVGYSSASEDFSQSVVGLTNNIFRNSVLQGPVSQWQLLGKTNTQGTNFGGFVGRNWQWDDIVLGVEANYNYLNNLSASKSDSLERTIVNPPGDNPPAGTTNYYDVRLDGSAAAKVKDAITFRGRAGWAYCDFLPYAFGGLAVGRMDVTRTVTANTTLTQSVVTTSTTTDASGNLITNTTTNNTTYPTQTQKETQGRSNNFAVGWTAGFGFEYALWSNVFLRGEWEYIKLMSVEDTKVTLNSVRAGIGYKF